MKLLEMALAPMVIVCIYIYIRDKYEREPIKLVLTGLLFGIIITAPIVFVEGWIAKRLHFENQIQEAIGISFLVAALVEEAFKYIVLYFLIWKHREFDEKMDGIVYAVFISLGFAGLENVLYVFHPALGGYNTAIARAIFSVPGHGLFGVVMGYYFALGKFEKEKRVKYMVMAFAVPYLLHGVYDLILLSKIPYCMVVFLGFVIYLWRSGFNKIYKHIQSSPFK